MLLERAHPTMLARAAEGDEVAGIAGNVSRRLAVPAGLPRLQDRAAGWEEQLRLDARDFPSALPSRTVQAATATVRELAHYQPDTLIHGDLNTRNIRSSASWTVASVRKSQVSVMGLRIVARRSHHPFCASAVAKRSRTRSSSEGEEPARLRGGRHGYGRSTVSSSSSLSRPALPLLSPATSTPARQPSSRCGRYGSPSACV
ncbi:hypothetical protein [Streptomyces sp. NPDC006668]|uniref:hypothetical protein n=1 Tax=Streptomyces sp. NPDC006668 TaxID=3156903 RepID=UPI0034095575